MKYRGLTQEQIDLLHQGISQAHPTIQPFIEKIIEQTYDLGYRQGQIDLARDLLVEAKAMVKQ
jgi:hypothetical protein